MWKRQEAKHAYFLKTRNKTHLIMKITSNPRGSLNPQGEMVLESTRETIDKSLNFY